MSRLILVATTLLIPSILHAQSAGAGRPGPRHLLARDQEIALARSAAPAAVTDGARVLVWTGRSYEVAEPGKTGVVCLVNRSWPESLEPECYDAEAARTIMPMEIRRTELYHAGTPAAQVEAEIASGLLDGRYRLPTRPAMAYMMSAGQQLVGDDGQKVGAWKPHLMLYVPYLTNAEIGMPTPDIRAGMIVDEGKPTANLMVVVPSFIQPRTPGPSR